MGKLLDRVLAMIFLDIGPQSKNQQVGQIKLVSFFRTKATINNMRDNLQNAIKYLQIIYLINS